VLGFCSIPLQRRLIKKKIHLFNNKLMWCLINSDVCTTTEYFLQWFVA
jgi:hypothetical protein